MTKQILFALSSPIIRNNGINTFIRETTHILREAGHTVDFVTDNPVEFDIKHYFNNYYCPADNYKYPVPDKTGMHSIDIIPDMSQRISDLYTKVGKQYDYIVSNDAQCSLALCHLDNVIHQLHTAALLDEVNTTWLSDDYVQIERDVMKRCIVGVPTNACKSMLGNDYNYLLTGTTLNNYKDYLKQRTDDNRGILFIGEGTYRKGADLYMKHTQHLVDEQMTQRKVISSGEPEVEFTNCIKRKFVDDEVAKQRFIRSSKICYFPSRSEVMAYGVMEALLSQPVYVDSTPQWAANVLEVGAIATTEWNAPSMLQQSIMRDVDYDPQLAIDYFENSKQRWLQI